MTDKIFSAEEARSMVKLQQLTIEEIMQDIQRRCKYGSSEITYDNKTTEMSQDIENQLINLGYSVERKSYSHTDNKFITVSWSVKSDVKAFSVDI